MAKMKKVLLMLLEGGSSQDKIAAILHVSKRDVSEASKTIKEYNLTYEAVLGMDPIAVEDTFFPKASRGRKKDGAYLQPDMELYIERKKKCHKLLVKQFWQEYVSAALIQEKLAYSYQSFCEQFSAEAERLGATQHFRHTPGEKAYIDWAGDTARLTDRITGKTTKVYVLVVALPFSGLFWARGFTDMRQQSWLEGHMAAFEMFGGVPRMLIPDNCATAVNRGSVYETLLNKDYERFAEHYGSAVVPARVRRPRDKSTGEGSVNLVEEWVVAPSSEMRFYTLEEFNEFCAGRVAWLNSRPFSAKDGSREELFEAEEAEQLLPLPPERYEMCRWCYPVVSPDYHITIDYMHYSVPYALIGRTLEAKVTASKVAVYDDGELVCEHKRMTGKKNQYETFEEHMPPNHRDTGSPWSRERFTSWAAKIGPETEAAITRLLDSKLVVEQAFVPCRNILGLSKRYTPQLLEAACAQVNALGALPSHTGVKNAILSIKADSERRQAARAGAASPAAGSGQLVDRAAHAGRLRGADAYRRREDRDAD